MPIERHDPLSVSQITQEQVEAKNKGTIHTPRPPQTGHHPTIKPMQNNLHSKENADLKDDFLNLLMPSDITSSNTSSTDTKNKEKIRPSNGTKEFFLTHNKCEERKEKPENSTFSFSIVNSMAGEVQLEGEFSEGRCLVRMTLKKDLTVKEKAILAQILQTSLKNKLNTEVELKID